MQILMQALVKYEKILEHIEAEVKLARTDPTVLTITCKSGEIDESNFRITYCSLAEVRRRLEEAKKIGASTQRYEIMIERATRQSKPASDAEATSSTDAGPGANAIILEIINYGVGLALGIISTSVSYVPNALDLLSTTRGYREMIGNKSNESPDMLKSIGVSEPNQFEMAEKELIDELQKLAEANGKSKARSAEQWQQFREKTIAEFKQQISSFANADEPSVAQQSTQEPTRAE
jgi:hypothetical protein